MSKMSCMMALCTIRLSMDGQIEPMGTNCHVQGFDATGTPLGSCEVFNMTTNR